MAAKNSATKKLQERMAVMQSRLQEAEDTLEAIRSGAIDALVVHTPNGEQLFTLRGADQSYRALVEAMSEGAVTLNSGIISYCNRHFADMLGIPMERIFGASILEIVEAPGFTEFLHRLERAQTEHDRIEGRLRSKMGAAVPVLISGSHFQSEGQSAVGLVVTNISARKEAERIRQELSRSLLNAQEQERQRVARDLHDGVNQLLSSAKLRLSRGGGKLPSLREDLEQARSLVEKAITEVRTISRNLRPSELDDLGLISALRSLTHDFQKHTGIQSRFKSETPLRALVGFKEVDMALYRIAQEALNNVAKHSRATRVEVRVRVRAAEVHLIVRDNGRGFVRPGFGAKRSGWGLENMAERASLLGGDFQAVSKPRKGCEIAVRIPTAAKKRLKAK